VTIERTNDVFTCPENGCSHSSEDPRAMVSHYSRCKHKVKELRPAPLPPPIRQSFKCKVLPERDELEGKSPSVVALDFVFQNCVLTFLSRCTWPHGGVANLLSSSSPGLCLLPATL
jgi:hypothetical protein